MSIAKKHTLIFISFVILIYLLGWLLQTTILVNADVSWAMHVAKRMLAGGNYFNNFFEHNPPMLFYVHMPYVIFAKWCSIPYVLSLRIYFFLFASFSFYLCYLTVIRIFSEREKVLSYYFLIIILILFLVFVPPSFAQKEHLMLMLTLPYLLTVVVRLQNIKFSFYFYMIVGTMAAIGFAFKPFFLMTFVLIELYYLFCKKNLLAWLRTEVVIMGAILLGYTSAIIIFYQDYLQVVVPQALRLYYSGVGNPWYTLLNDTGLIFCYLAILFYLLCYQRNPFKKLSTIICIAIVGFIVAYLMQGTGFGYQLLPALDLSILLFALLFYGVAFQNEVSHREDIKLFWIGLGVLIYILIYFQSAWCALLLSFAGLAMLPIKRRSVLAHINTVAVGAVIFTFVFYITGNGYISAHSQLKQYNKLIRFIQTHVSSQQSIYFFTMMPQYTFPIVDYAHVEAASRAIMLWQIPGLLKQPQNLADRNFFIKMLTEDLVSKKPRLIFVDLLNVTEVIKPICFNYLLYLTQDEQFKQQWQHYRYLTTLDAEPTYKLAVYQRVD